MKVTVDHGSVVFLHSGDQIGRLPLTVPIDDVLGLLARDSAAGFDTGRTIAILERYVGVWIEAYGFVYESDEWEATYDHLHDAFRAQLNNDWQPSLFPKRSLPPNSATSPPGWLRCSNASPMGCPASQTRSPTKTSSPWPPGVSSKPSNANSSDSGTANYANSRGSAPPRETPTASGLRYSGTRPAAR